MIPPYMTQKIEAHYRATGQTELAELQRASDAHIAALYSKIGECDLPGEGDGPSNWRVRFSSKGEAAAVSAYVFSKTSPDEGTTISAADLLFEVSPGSFRPLIELPTAKQDEVVREVISNPTRIEALRESISRIDQIRSLRIRA